MTLLKTTLLCTAASALIAGCAQTYDSPDDASAMADKTEDARKPNIILIVADDMGYGDLGAFGQTKIATPALDAMAQDGAVLTDFYAGSTVCAPSRSVLMTGLHTGHTPVRGNADKTLQTLAPEDVTVAEVLKDAGYTTGLIGKWGLGDDGNTGLPNDQGFDYFFGYLNQVHAHNHYPDFLWRNKEKVALPNVVELAPEAYMSFHGGVSTEKNVYSGDLFFEESEKFIADNKDEPFFLFLALTSPHANNEAEKVDWAHGMEVPSYGAYEDKDWDDTAKGYAAMVSHIDTGVQGIVDMLEAHGLDDDTIVIFTSDNGPHKEGGNDPEFFDSNGPLRGIKRDLYEGGIRVPTIAWGPGIVPSGVTVDHVSYFGDFMQTAADLAGVDAPPNDGVSMAPLLTGDMEAQDGHDYLYWEFYEWGSAQAVRKGKWKAVRKPMFDGPIELYDLEADLGETNDLAADYPDLVAEMEAIMAKEHVRDEKWLPKLGAAGRL